MRIHGLSSFGVLLAVSASMAGCGRGEPDAGDVERDIQILRSKITALESRIDDTDQYSETLRERMKAQLEAYRTEMAELESRLSELKADTPAP